MSKSAKKIEELSYELAFTELEGIVAVLEFEGRSLDESILLYERGQALAQYCSGLLEQAELKVRLLNGGAPADFAEEA